MKKENRFAITEGWQLLLDASGIDTKLLLLRAELPHDLFSRKDASLSYEEYFRLWREMETLKGDPSFSISLIESMSSDVFSPPVFAAYCSPNLATALQRLKLYKRLVCPLDLDINSNDQQTRLTVRFTEDDTEIPRSLFGLETGFFVQLTRMATKEKVVPLQVTSPVDLPNLQRYEDYFGVGVTRSDAISVTFSAEDVNRPFLSENAQIWEFFEPCLRKCLSKLDAEETMSGRVRSTLLELLPSGQANVAVLASRLAVSTRTLQRRLGEEGTSFKKILANVREELAHHYITKSDLPYSQISFLLGYEDPNSFFRAFNAWTGTTPDSVRTGQTQ